MQIIAIFTSMFNKWNLPWIIFGGMALFVKVFSSDPDLVEVYYSLGMYPYIAQFQRLLLGWVPFSIGDLIYFVAGLYLLKASIGFVKKGIKKEITWRVLLISFRRIALVALVVYVSFNLLWGLNYNRVPIQQRLGLNTGTYSADQLSKVVTILIDSLNAIDSTGINDEEVLKTKKTIFETAADSYVLLGTKLPDLSYHMGSVKPSLYSHLGNYLGFSGYYNPFTGEAQVNTTVPAFVQPFVACHEIGHQLGYGKEDEANFAGFLAATSSNSSTFRYSAYFDMYAYARRELFQRDSIMMKSLHQRLRPGVKADILTVREFYRKYQNPFEPVIRSLYAQYLKANQQPKGMLSYNAVVSMLVAYYDKQGVL